jgi:hypothetical protein
MMAAHWLLLMADVPLSVRKSIRTLVGLQQKRVVPGFLQVLYALACSGQGQRFYRLDPKGLNDGFEFHLFVFYHRRDSAFSGIKGVRKESTRT